MNFIPLCQVVWQVNCFGGVTLLCGPTLQTGVHNVSNPGPIVSCILAAFTPLFRAVHL